MEINPVIYILNGKCVSLYKGDFKQMTVYPRKPQNYAANYVKEGAKRILLIDLDASNEHRIVNKKIIKEIVDNHQNLEVQYTGGLRTIEEVDIAFEELGVKKVIIGVSGLSIIPKAIQKYGADNVYSGVKAKDEKIISEFTSEQNPYEVFDFALELKNLNVKNFFYHDIWSEGTMIHPNYDGVEKILATTDLNVYIGGGISKVKHLNLLRQLGVKGVYIGKALLENRLNLRELTIFEVLN
ncbi:MAG: HisA/HisF-related TIM barrel protein [Candidatus Gracilibacteria bacterium]